jgi:selenophosphate synthetase-related protein
VGEVLVNGQVAIRVRTTFDGLPPLQRAEQAAARLKRALAAQFSPADIRVAKSNDGVAVAIGDKVLCIADGPQAAMLKTTPDKLAQGWASALKKALMAAAAK